MTTSEDVLLREVDEDLNQDRQLAAFKKYGPAIGVGIALLLGVIAFFQLRAAREEAAREEASEAYEFALGESAGADALFDFADTAPAEGYRALALMRAAGTAARSGERVRAIEAYARVHGDETLPPALRDLARLRAGYLALEDGGTAADAIVSGVTSAAFRPYAAEISGLSAMSRGDYAGAIGAFGEAAADEGSGAAARAATFLALAKAGRDGVALEAREDADDFIGAFGRALAEGRLDQPGGDGAGTGDEAGSTGETVPDPGAPAAEDAAAPDGE